MIEKPRIKSGEGFLRLGVVCFVFFVLLSPFALAGADGAFPLAAVFGGASAWFLAIGFWRELFFKIELRLIDIQKALSGEPAAVAGEPAPLREAKPADDYLG